ncbi:hypothetical protein CTheo_3813 [Ceratobasidium theobromae]|uniref:Uncharacterized protein n=1 Tax=Ceratobasidium theobromae TaxID=1582974 RepID=A0A5N5QLU4_9AGAM|nr:hypothetical protein CTheo_3813 [Ceratobasidium theobromae]
MSFKSYTRSSKSCAHPTSHAQSYIPVDRLGERLEEHAYEIVSRKVGALELWRPSSNTVQSVYYRGSRDTQARLRVGTRSRSVVIEARGEVDVVVQYVDIGGSEMERSASSKPKTSSGSSYGRSGRTMLPARGELEVVYEEEVGWNAQSVDNWRRDVAESR